MSSISSISASTPPTPPAAVVQTPDTSAQSPDPTADGDAGDAGAAQQTALPIAAGTGNADRSTRLSSMVPADPSQCRGHRYPQKAFGCPRSY